MPNTIIQYDFKLSHETYEYQVKLDSRSFEIQEAAHTYPSWTELEFNQCPHCPLDPQQYQYCPMAKQISTAVEFFAEIPSYEQLEVEVSTDDRRIVMQTDAQDGMRSLMGLIMATAGCPHMDWLKPMARFHLPKASMDETLYRVTSMYLLAQHFVAKRGGNPDWELRKLPNLYANVETINEFMLKRLRTIISKDCSVNAIVILSIFSARLNESVTEPLEALEYLFEGFQSRPNNSPTFFSALGKN